MIKPIVVLPPEGFAVGPAAAAAAQAEAAKAAADRAILAAISTQPPISGSGGGESTHDRLSAQRMRQLVDAAGAVVEVTPSAPHRED